MLTNTYYLLMEVWVLPTLLLFEGCPKQVDGWFSGQMGGAGLLVDMSHTVSAVAL